MTINKCEKCAFFCINPNSEWYLKCLLDDICEFIERETNK